MNKLEIRNPKLKMPLIEPYKAGYRLDGVYVPRVTTILSVINKPPILIWVRRQALKIVRETLEPVRETQVRISQDWIDSLIAQADREPDRIKESAADIGTRAHEAIHKLILGESPEITPDILPCIESFMRWYEQSGIQLHFGEIRVGSKRHLYAGTMDAIGRRGRDLIIPDWKTSNGIYDEYAFQVAAYCKAWEEMTGEPAKEAWVIRFPKAPPPADLVPETRAWIPFEAKQIKDIDGAFRVFLAAKEIYEAQKTRWFL